MLRDAVKTNGKLATFSIDPANKKNTLKWTKANPQSSQNFMFMVPCTADLY